MREINNPDFDTLQSSLGPLSVRWTTLRKIPQKEADLPLEAYDQAVSILSEGLYKKEAAARSLLSDVLREFSYFKALENQPEYFEHIEECLKVVEFRQVKKGHFVFHCGDKGDYFYLIFKGAVNVYAPRKEDDIHKQKQLLARLHLLKETLSSPSSQQDQKAAQREIVQVEQQLKEFQDDELLLANKSRYYQRTNDNQYVCTYKKVNFLKQGDCFGEVSLFRNEPRAASIVAIEPLYLACLNKSDYLRIFGNKLEKLNFTLGSLSKIFPDSAREVVIQLSFDFIRKRLTINQQIFKEGDQVDGLYLIYSGTVETTSNGMKVNQFGEGSFLGLFDFSNPGVRTYSAVSVSFETVVFFLPLKLSSHLDRQMRGRMQELRKASENFRIGWIEKCHKIIQKEERNETKKMLSQISLRPKEILQMCLKSSRKQPRAPTLSEDRIQEIMRYNHNIHVKTEKPPETIKLCLQMKDFEKEREFIAKQFNGEKKTGLPQLRKRAVNFKNAISSISSMFSSQSNSAMEPQTEREIRNIHIERMNSVRRKKPA